LHIVRGTKIIEEILKERGKWSRGEGGMSSITKQFCYSKKREGRGGEMKDHSRLKTREEISWEKNAEKQLTY